jgi:hypothetical protein
VALTAQANRKRRFAAAAARLREIYARRGQLRVRDESRGRNQARGRRNHGHEIRFRTYGARELTEVLRLLRTVGIPTGRPYPVSSSGTAVPIYGRKRTLSAVRELRLKRPPVRPVFRLPVPRAKAPPRLSFSTLRQLEVAMLMYGRGPLMVAELNTSGAMLAEMARHRLVMALPNRSGRSTAWVLTLRGEEQTRRGRRAYLDWLRSGRQGRFLRR